MALEILPFRRFPVAQRDRRARRRPARSDGRNRPPQGAARCRDPRPLLHRRRYSGHRRLHRRQSENWRGTPPGFPTRRSYSSAFTSWPSPPRSSAEQAGAAARLASGLFVGRQLPAGRSCEIPGETAGRRTRLRHGGLHQHVGGGEKPGRLDCHSGNAREIIDRVPKDKEISSFPINTWVGTCPR